MDLLLIMNLLLDRHAPHLRRSGTASSPGAGSVVLLSARAALVLL